jgi:UDP-galactopyranose mutase
VHKYGPHIFHTNDERVWRYVNCFGSWHRYEHKVLALVDGRYVPMPVNITTVNELCGESLTTTEDMEKWLTQNVSCYGEITNSEQMAKSRIGEFLYENPDNTKSSGRRRHADVRLPTSIRRLPNYLTPTVVCSRCWANVNIRGSTNHVRLSHA